LNEKYGKITPFALDRIERLDLLQTKYIMNESVDFETYFDEMVGVTISSNKEVEEVLLLIDVEQLPYVLSKPIHKSQRLVKTNEDGSAIIVIHVIPNFELIQLLLSFGERVTILSPASLRQEIIGRIEKNMKNYQ
jgi:predicted DNA-binding transcriptional regulator YafY